MVPFLVPRHNAMVHTHFLWQDEIGFIARKLNFPLDTQVVVQARSFDQTKSESIVENLYAPFSRKRKENGL